MRFLFWKIFTDLSGQMGLGSGGVLPSTPANNDAGTPIGLLLVLTNAS